LDTAKAFLIGKFIAMSAYIKRTERNQTKWPNASSQTPKKEEQAKPYQAEGEK
jgi:hypothetical protein